MFPKNSAFEQPHLDGMEEFMKNLISKSLEPTDNYPADLTVTSQVHDQLAFYLTEAQYAIERLSDRIPSEVRGELADILHFVEQAQREHQTLQYG